ncbi:UNVERIFIED_CONTAM: hypothetical protein FKN15_077884 [Acipenser sinensis]
MCRESLCIGSGASVGYGGKIVKDCFSSWHYSGPFWPGFDLTPNYIDSSSTNITVSPWCSCKGSGNREEECEKFLRDFRDNSCLRNAIQAFGNGTDTNLAPKTPSSSVTQSVKTTVTEDIPKPSINPIDIKPGDDACVFPTCANLQAPGELKSGDLQGWPLSSNGR